MCKIANVILENLDEVIPLKTTQGQRIKRIASLTKHRREDISSDIDLFTMNLTYGYMHKFMIY